MPTLVLSLALLCAGTCAETELPDYLTGLPELNGVHFSATPTTVPFRPDPIGILLVSLPEQSRTFWTRRLARLSSYDASAALLIINNDRVTTVPLLRLTDDGFMILPADRLPRSE